MLFYSPTLISILLAKHFLVSPASISLDFCKVPLQACLI